MEATIDSGGRILVPKRLREALGLSAGAKVDISLYGGALQITPDGRIAELVTTADGRLVAQSEAVVTYEAVGARVELLATSGPAGQG